MPGITFDANTDRDITSPQHEKIAEEMLGDPANDSRPFFFWAHFLDPHDLYQLHDGIDWGNNPRDRYDGEVTFTDQYIGKLLDFIAERPWAKRTTIIVTADHGEEFGEHGMTRHGFEVWNTLVHVPLMILAPGAAPRHVDVLRSGIDLAPTILELLGVTGRPLVRGHVARERSLRRPHAGARRGRRSSDDERQRAAARAGARHREAHLLRQRQRLQAVRPGRRSHGEGAHRPGGPVSRT